MSCRAGNYFYCVTTIVVLWRSAGYVNKHVNLCTIWFLSAWITKISVFNIKISKQEHIFEQNIVSIQMIFYCVYIRLIKFVIFSNNIGVRLICKFFRSVLKTTLYNKVCQWLAEVFSGYPVWSTQKFDHHDITEIS